MLTTVAAVVPMRNAAAPLASRLPLNCTNAESFCHESFCALPRIQRRYGLPAWGRKFISKKLAGDTEALASFAAPASGFARRTPSAAVASAVSVHPPAMRLPALAGGR